jgi:hypothetical protein
MKLDSEMNSESRKKGSDWIPDQARDDKKKLDPEILPRRTGKFRMTKFYEFRSMLSFCVPRQSEAKVGA